MKPREEWSDLMTAKDIKDCLGWGSDRVFRIMNLPDFPLVDKTVKRNKQVTKDALWAWLNRGVDHG